MRIVVAVPEAHVSKPVLDGALEAVTRLNEQLIEAGATPTSDQLIEAGAKWKPEKPGDEHFDHGATIAKRGWGDCDDWAPLHAATLRATGEDPGAMAVVRKSGPKRWHAIVQRSDGTFDDPSLEAGMPGPARAVGVHGAYVPTMRPRETLGPGVHGSYIATPQLALRPVADRDGQIEAWQARADLPWHWQPTNSPADLAMVSLHQSPVSDQAVVGAVRGAWRLGLASGYSDPEHLRRLAAIADACEGCGWEDLADRYGAHHANAAGELVEGWFGKKLLRRAKKLAKGGLKAGLKMGLPMASTLIPGGGLASAALKMASPALKAATRSKRHLPPPQRARALAETQSLPSRRASRPSAPSSRGFRGGPTFVPVPYPMPYPIPGWAGPAAQPPIPGMAWPPRS